MFAERLNDLITHKNINRNKLAVATGISSSMIHDYSKGKKTPSDNIVKLADYFGVSPHYLLGNDNAPLNLAYNNVAGIGIIQATNSDIGNISLHGEKTSNDDLATEDMEMLRLFKELNFIQRNKVRSMIISFYEENKQKA